jgi:hypothetical protein
MIMSALRKRIADTKRQWRGARIVAGPDDTKTVAWPQRQRKGRQVPAMAQDKREEGYLAATGRHELTGPQKRRSARKLRHALAVLHAGRGQHR